MARTPRIRHLRTRKFSRVRHGSHLQLWLKEQATRLSMTQLQVFNLLKTKTADQITVMSAGAVTVPGAPTIGVATAGNASISITFTPPVSNGGATITSYRATASSGEFADGASSPIVITGLANGAAKTVTVKALNSQGFGPSSAVSNSVTPTASVTAPGAPTGVSAVAGNASASVSFTAPASNGGATITGYRVTASTGQTATGANSPISVTGLTNGTPVTFTVQAQNSQGYGTASAASSAVTPAATWNTVLAATQWNAIANIKESRGGLLSGYLSRMPGRVGSNPLKKIYLSFSALYLLSTSTGMASDLGNDMPIQDVSIEYNGVCVPVTFSGIRTKNLVNGTSDIWADVIDVQTAFGVSELPIDALVWVKMRVLLASGADSMPAAAPRPLTHVTGSQCYFYNPAAATFSSTDTAGAYTPLTGTVNTDYQTRSSGYTPWILGIHSTQSDAWVASGDSITADTGDSGTNSSGLGWFQRLMGMFTKKMASINVAVHGSNRLAGADDPRITDLYKYATLGVILKGTNDFSTNGTNVTVATLITGVTKIKDSMKAAGVRAVGVCAPPPRTNTTNAWIDEANQTPFTGWDSTSSFGYLYKQQLPLPGFDFAIPFNSVRGTVSQFNWKPNDAYDTTHPNPAGNTDMATEALPIAQPFILY